MNGAKIILQFLFLLNLSCKANSVSTHEVKTENQASVIVGAERFNQYITRLNQKNVGLVVNHSSIVGFPKSMTHLLDTLLRQGIAVKKIFTPEHGLRGVADAGEKVKGGIDEKTGLPVVSLYGNKKKPVPEDLADLDVIVFDIQDVGARFYTYISTMHYVMEACAENKKPFLVLDRPNPNGFYVDGPVLDTAFRSFVGMHPVPIVYGMTIGEYAKMINGEKWLKGKKQCELTVIPCMNYDHGTMYNLPVRPSPNLPTMTAIYNYPSLCLFEGTAISVGRGTDKPFMALGYPEFPSGGFGFQPRSQEGAKEPLYEGKICYGIDLSGLPAKYFQQKRAIDLTYLIDLYQKYPYRDKYFNSFFEKLAGNSELRKQIETGKSEEEIRSTWQQELEKFMKVRKKYLLYKDFE